MKDSYRTHVYLYLYVALHVQNEEGVETATRTHLYPPPLLVYTLKYSPPSPVVKDGITEHVTRAAIVIQAAYRGYRARRIYGPVLAEHIPVDPKLRQKFYNQKVANVTATIVADANKRANVSHV